MENLKKYEQYFNDIESRNYFGRLGKTFMTKKITIIMIWELVKLLKLITMFI